MKMYTKRIISALLALLLIISVFPAASASAAVSLTKVGALWDGYTAGTGTFTVSESSRLYVVSSSAPTGDLLQTAQLIQRQLRAQFGSSYFTNLIYGAETKVKSGDIVLKLDTASSTGADGYKLNVTSASAIVTAADTDGLIYGTNNLMKCFLAVGSNSISCFTGNDSPDTVERTVHLDLARKYYTVEWVKNFIRQMSWMGYNALELHLSEDGGFRADFWDSNYYTDNYQPENDFSWLCGSHVQSWVYNEVLPDGTTANFKTDPDAGKYLTTAELVQICDVAKEYHIEIIPSFDSPAHMDYITWKFEQNYKSNKSYSFTYNGTTYKASSTSGCINYTGKTGSSTPAWPYYTTIDITEGTMAKAFVFALYEDMADFFKEYAGSTNFNIGADEVNLSSSYGPKWSYSAFPGYVNSLNRMLNDKGYTVRMYNDFIGSTTYNQKNSKAVYSFDSNIEICYWNSDYNPNTGKWTDATWHVKFFWENNTGTTDNWGDGGRTMYNCIQTNTYYVLRVGTSGNNRDARDPENRNWTFYGTNEEDIYNNWYPADISEKGDYTENAADVPADQLGGAYFLIWNDYAAVNNESEVWNGALDGWDKDRYYYLFDIMASNIIKMWNVDINDSVTYTNFAAVRDTQGWFPGFTSCSKAASLPAATTPVKAVEADHDALTAALATKISNADGAYTATSYAAYDSAYNAAVTVNNNDEATQTQVDDALAALNSAIDALVDLSALKNAVKNAPSTESAYTASSWDNLQDELSDAKEVIADADATKAEVNEALSELNAAVASLVKRADYTALSAAVQNAPTAEAGYTASSWAALQNALYAADAVINDADAVQADADDALAALNAAIDALVDISELNGAIAGAYTEQGNYTDETWAAYVSALNAAKDVQAKANATQTEVDNALAALNAARKALKIENTSGIEIINIRKASKYTSLGRKATLTITTSVNVSDLKILLDGQEVTLSTCNSSVQTLSGEQVRVWYVKFTTTIKGSIDYTVCIDNAVSEIVTITVK